MSAIAAIAAEIPAAAAIDPAKIAAAFVAAESAAAYAVGFDERAGGAARDAIAAQLRKDSSYSSVATEVTGNTKRRTSLGERHVDIVASQRGSRPEMNKQVEIESKLGRASASVETRRQVAKDAERLGENRSVRRIGAALEGIGKVARPVGVAVDDE